MNEKNPFTPEQQAHLERLCRVVGSLVHATHEAQIAVAAGEHLLKQHLVTDAEWIEAVRLAKQRWRTEHAIAALGDEDLDVFLDELNRRGSGDEKPNPGRPAAA